MKLEDSPTTFISPVRDHWILSELWKRYVDQTLVKAEPDKLSGNGLTHILY